MFIPASERSRYEHDVGNGGRERGNDMDLKNIEADIQAAKGIAVIRLGFWLNRKPDKTTEETAAAKAFVKTFWSTWGIVLSFVVILFILIGYMMAAPSAGFQGDYAESRTGRIENGQIRYVKNELHYISPEEIGLPVNLPDGTHINLYFDENDRVIAGENADKINQETERRVLLAVIAMGAMAVALTVFAIVARKTFGKPWYQWLQAVRDVGGGNHNRRPIQ